MTILDDGVEKDHPDLRRNYLEQASWDINNDDNDPTPRYNPSNENRYSMPRQKGGVQIIKDIHVIEYFNRNLGTVLGVQVRLALQRTIIFVFLESLSILELAASECLMAM